MLCLRCKDVFRGSFQQYPYQDHHNTVADLHKAAQEGCWICDKIWKKLFEEYWKHCTYQDNLTIQEKSKALVEDLTANPANPFTTYNLEIIDDHSRLPLSNELTFNVEMETFE